MLKLPVEFAEVVSLEESTDDAASTHSNAPASLFDVEEGERENDIGDYTGQVEPCDAFGEFLKYYDIVTLRLSHTYDSNLVDLICLGVPPSAIGQIRVRE